MNHKGPIQVISGKDNRLADYLIRIFNRNPDCFKVKSQLSEALDDTVDLVIGDPLPYRRMTRIIDILKKDSVKTPEIKALGDHLQENILDFLDFSHKKPGTYVHKPALYTLKRLEKDAANDNTRQ